MPPPPWLDPTSTTPYSDKDSNMEQELANCHAVYDIATYKKRRLCVTVKKCVTRYIQIRLFTATENELLKQVAYVKYVYNERIQRNRPSFGNFMFVENRTLKFKNFVE